MNSCVTAKWIGVNQSVARYLQSAIDGCNKAHGKSYFNRDLAKFTARSLTITPTPWRHFAWLLRLDRILWRHRKLGRRSARRYSGRWRRRLWRRWLRHFFRYLCFCCGHGICASRGVLLLARTIPSSPRGSANVIACLDCRRECRIDFLSRSSANPRRDFLGGASCHLPIGAF